MLMLWAVVGGKEVAFRDLRSDRGGVHLFTVRPPLRAG